MKTKHTPGPWARNGLQIRAVNKHETFIGEVFEQNENAKANADLISASPDLLAALEDLLNQTELNMDDMEQATLETIEKAQAAIKKAKGEA